MNLREGTRRLALLLGAVGAIVGGFASYSELQSIKEQRASHIKFEQLASSPVSRQARESLENACADGHTDKQCGDEKYAPMTEVKSGEIKTIYWSKKDSVGKINYQVSLIQTEDGQNLFPTSAPSAWNNLLIALFPILGFFIPWGAVCAIGWVGAGFIQSSK
jgi:hypothetical protein